MEAADARDIQQRHRLLTRDQSKHVLRAILREEPIDSSILSDKVTEGEIEELRQMVRSRLASLPARDKYDAPGGSPRNLVYYRILEERKKLSWRRRGRVTEQGHEEIDHDTPLVEGLRPSLLSLLLERVSDEAQTRAVRVYKSVRKLPATQADALLSLIDEAAIARPSQTTMEAVVAAVTRANHGEALTVVTPLCPDYEAEPVGPGLFRYTFDNLGSGIGIVGKRYLDALPLLRRRFAQMKVTATFVPAVGDFEAFSAENRDRLGVNEATFVERLRGSVTAISEGADGPVRTTLFTEIGGGKARWLEDYQEIRARFESGDFGCTGLNEQDLDVIAESRQPLYERWYGPVDKARLRRIVISQGAEYATMGRFVRRAFPNCLILGADHARMAAFYPFDAPIATLYLRNNYTGVS